jgi:ABC-type transport system substrate-binding protein
MGLANCSTGGATSTAYAIPDARDGCCFQRRTKDLEARKQLIFDIQRYAAEQQYYVYTNSNMLTGSWQPYVKNFAPNMSFDYGNRAAALWLDR